MGISNLLSGLTGGYTGSYIFSQTLFSLRRGVKSRVAGAAMAVVELLVLALPVSVASYLPKVCNLDVDPQAVHTLSSVEVHLKSLVSCSFISFCPFCSILCSSAMR